MSREQRPNIIFIMADQLGAAFHNCYGSGVPSTPTLDRLAEKGCRFDRFYAHCPVCAPNRATLFTGRSIEVHGITTNNLTLTEAFPTFVEVLRQDGYVTGGFGKFHQTPMQQPLPKDFNVLGFDEAIPTEDPKLGPWLDWIAAEHPEYYEQALAVTWPMPYITSYGPDCEDITESMKKAREHWLQPLQEASDWHHMYSSPLPAELHQTTFITDCGIDFIKRHAAEGPFFCQISYVDPHDPYDPPKPYDTMFDPETMEAPIPMAVPEYKTKILQDVLDFAGFSAIAKNPDAVKKLRSLYHGSIKFIDDQIDRLLTTLETEGLLENTIIVYTTDHGDMMGDHGFMTKGVKHYDSAIRCPLIIAGKGIKSGKVLQGLSSSLDMYPTLLELAGCIEIPPVEGVSLYPLIAQHGEAFEGDTEEILVQSPFNAEGHVDTIITREGWRLSVFEDGAIQLFNLIKDPREQQDLSEIPAYTGVVQELLIRLVQLKARSGSVQQYPVLPVEGGKKAQVLHDIAGPMTPTWTRKSFRKPVSLET